MHWCVDRACRFEIGLLGDACVWVRWIDRWVGFVLGRTLPRTHALSLTHTSTLEKQDGKGQEEHVGMKGREGRRRLVAFVFV